MTWPGKPEVNAVLTGRQQLVALGGSLVPPRVDFRFEGHKGSPDLRMRFEVRDGRPECVELAISARPGGRGIQSHDLASLNVDKLVVRAFEEVAFRFDQSSGTAKHPGDEKAAWAVRGDIDAARKRGRPGPSRGDLERVAAVYRENLATGAPTEAVARVLGLSKRTANRRVAQAREEGML